MTLDRPAATATVRLPTIQVLRGVAAMSVLLFHTSYIIQVKWNEDFARAVFLPGWSGVDFFFVLSGFIICYTHFRDFGHPDRLRSYLVKRFTRIYPIYWAITILLLPVYFVVRSFGTGYETQLPVIFRSLLLWPDVHVVIAQGWTLSYEVLFYLAIACLIGVRPIICIPILGAWVLVVALEEIGLLHIAGLSTLTVNYSVAGVALSPLILEFLFGCLVAVLVRFAIGKRYLPWVAIVAGCVGFALSWVAFIDGRISGDVDIRIWTFGLSSAVLVFGVAHFDIDGRIPIFRLPLLIGDASYSIYLVHYAALSLMVKVLSAFDLQRLPVPVLGTIVALLGLAVGLVCHVVLERPLIEATRRVLGRTISSEPRVIPLTP